MNHLIPVPSGFAILLEGETPEEAIARRAVQDRQLADEDSLIYEAHARAVTGAKPE